MPLFCGLFGVVFGTMTQGPHGFLEDAMEQFLFNHAAHIRRYFAKYL